MKTIEHFLIELGGRDIVLRSEEGNLKVSAPKGAMTAELAARIKENKDEILAFLARQNTSRERIPRAPRDRDLPLSFAQQRMWFLDQLEESGATYNVPSAFKLTGDMSIPAIKAALQEIVARHEVLRTSFLLKENGPVQVIHHHFELPVPVGDLQPLFARDPQAGMAEIKRLVHEEAHAPFDLAAGPMWRAMLYITSPESLVLLINMHHIVADGWSMDVVMNEFGVLYEAFVAGKSSPLPEPEIQYADFASWQRDWMQGEQLRRQQDYWKQQLADLPPLLELPTDFPRPAVQNFEGRLELVGLAPALVKRLQEVSRQNDATLFMVMMAVFNMLMARLSGQNDIAVGSPIANRDRAEIGDLVGYFANTFVLRTHVDPESSFKQLLARVRKHTLDAYDHQDLPFEHLVDLLQPERSLAYSPIFQAMFTLGKTIARKAEFHAGWQASSIDHGATTSKFDLTINLTETEEGINGFVEYSTALFEASTINRWFGYYVSLLEQVCENQDAVIGKMPLLAGAEHNQVLHEWNDSGRQWPFAGCIHQHFERQAAETPDKIAVVFDAMCEGPGNQVESLTYEGLERRANRIAHYLHSRGLGPDGCVGLCMERSVDMVVGMLGILKAGAAYVPLDPAYPPDRLAYMLDDAGIALVITQPDLAAGFDKPGVEAVFLEDRILKNHPETCIPSNVTPDNLLYITYTSGSTGQPKGIALSHFALVNLVLWHLEALPPVGGVLQFASMSFDASYHEIFAAWCCGETLYLIPEELRYDLEQLPVLLQHHKVGKAILPVVVLQQWAEIHGDRPELFAHFRDVITTGEQLQITPAISGLLSQLPEARLHNHYGPAETHVVTAYSFDGKPEDWPYHAPIGYPIANTSIYIVDEQLHPVPRGVKGHLYIGGHNLARGYFGKARMTAEKFVPDTYGNNPGGRLYKTGDLARYLPGGKIEFLGRSDHMIKLRGFRIEPDEVEAALTAHELVNRAIVMIRGKAASEKRLVAWVVPHEDAPRMAETLRDHAIKHLPEYMVPSAFVVLDQMPLTPTGKVDRKALPDPDFTASVDQEVVPASTETEALLVAIWAEILQISSEKVGIHHNFFELGGHSLLATRVISRLRGTFEVELPLRSLFINATPAKLAEEIDTKIWLAGSRQAAAETSDAFEEEL